MMLVITMMTVMVKVDQRAAATGAPLNLVDVGLKILANFGL